MVKRAAALLLVCAVMAVGIGCSGTQSHFVYAGLPSANEVGVYREDPNSGVLTQLAASPYTAGNGAGSIAVHPSGKFLYVANSSDSTISLFNISSAGGLTEVTPRTTAGSTPVILATDSAGAYLYEGDSGSKSITVYSIDSGSGALTKTGNQGIGLQPLSMKLNASGTVLFVSGSAGTTGYILAFSVSAGVLTSAGTFLSGGASPYGMFIDTASSHLYVANGAPDNSIGEFTIGSSPLLTPLAGSPIGQTNGVNPLSIVIEPSGKYLYVANEGSANVSGYTVASDGSLTVLTTSTFTTGTQPNSIVADPNGKYLLVGNQSSGIQVFSLDKSTGDLSSVTTFSTGSNPGSLAVTQ